MWFEPLPGLDPWGPAIEHLGAADGVLRKLIERVGPCTLRPRHDPFVALCQAIFTQQVSTAVATVLFARFRKLFPGGRVTPRRLLELTDEQLATAGLSRQKKAYLRDLAGHFASGKLPVRRFGEMSDQEVIDALVPIKGIGRWTAEMFLIFVLNRPDVWPVDDLGVKRGVQLAYGYKSLPAERTLRRVADAWRPWRTVGTWYLWRGIPLMSANGGRTDG